MPTNVFGVQKIFLKKKIFEKKIFFFKMAAIYGIYGRGRVVQRDFYGIDVFGSYK